LGRLWKDAGALEVAFEKERAQEERAQKERAQKGRAEEEREAEERKERERGEETEERGEEKEEKAVSMDLEVSVERVEVAQANAVQGGEEESVSNAMQMGMDGTPTSYVEKEDVIDEKAKKEEEEEEEEAEEVRDGGREEVYASLHAAMERLRHICLAGGPGGGVRGDDGAVGGRREGGGDVQGRQLLAQCAATCAAALLRLASSLHPLTLTPARPHAGAAPSQHTLTQTHTAALELLVSALGAYGRVLLVLPTTGGAKLSERERVRERRGLRVLPTTGVCTIT